MPQNPVKTTCYFTVITTWARKWIVSLALWGWLPLRLVKWVLGDREDRG